LFDFFALRFLFLTQSTERAALVLPAAEQDERMPLAGKEAFHLSQASFFFGGRSWKNSTTKQNRMMIAKTTATQQPKQQIIFVHL